jgi:serine/threonine-protein kinase GIN4
VNPSPLIKIGPAHSRKRVVAAPASDLSPIQASPPATPRGKENANAKVPKSSHKSNRKPFGNANNKENIAQPQFLKPVGQTQAKRRSQVLGDSTARYAHGENVGKAEKVKEVMSKEKSNHVKDRVRDWERERQRLREIQRLEELETESEEQEEQASKIGDEDAQEPVQEERLTPPVAYQSPRIPSTPSSGTSPEINLCIDQRSEPSYTATLNALGDAARRASNPALNHLKHSIKKSIGSSYSTPEFFIS